MVKENIFSKENVNKGRQLELDLAKGFTIFLMVLCHSYMEFIPLDTVSYPYQVAVVLFELITGAPLFMVCMGIGLIYSRNSSPAECVKRGFSLLWLGYLLNFLSKGLPALVAVKGLGYQGEVDWYYAFFDVDIMQFAGMAFFVFAFLKKFHIKEEVFFGISILCSGLGLLLQHVSSGNMFLDSFLGLIWGTCPVSEFALVNWLIFPAYGMLFGKVLIRCQNKDKAYKRVLAVTGPITIIMYACNIILPEFTLYTSNGEFYWMGPIDAAMFLIAGSCFIALCHFLCKIIPTAIREYLKGLSNRINTVYCCHWIIIGWISYIFIRGFGFMDLPWWLPYLLFVPITLLCNQLSILWLDFKKKRN